jgi:hypothetical protein
MRRVVTRLPDGVTSRESTSQDIMCDAYGLGYRRKYARETIDQESLHEVADGMCETVNLRLCIQNILIKVRVRENLHMGVMCVQRSV